jgi:hypothetical protein
VGGVLPYRQAQIGADRSTHRGEPGSERNTDRVAEPDSGQPADPTTQREPQIDPAPTDPYGEPERDRDEHQSVVARIMSQSQEQNRDRGMEIE